jgi:hypothetical protein
MKGSKTSVELFLFLSLVHIGRGDISDMLTFIPLAGGRSDES